MGKKVLVIDDDPTSGLLMESRLSKAGYEVTRALNGLLGLESARRLRPDLIVLDIEMPEMNGYTFIMELKKDELFKDMPVVVLTAHEENRAIFARRGISNYFVKPVNFDQLLNKVAELLAAR